MKTDKEILDEFGELLVKKIFDSKALSVDWDNQKMNNEKRFSSIMGEITEEKKNALQSFIINSAFVNLFSTLLLFEEHPNFKIIYQDGDQRIDLSEASARSHSGMLQGEIHGEEGWVARFSKYADKVPDDILPRG